MPTKGLIAALSGLTVLILATLGLVLAIVTGVLTPPGLTAEDPAGPADPVGEAADAEYVALEPALTVNLTDEEPARYLEAEVEIAATSGDVLDSVEQHDAAIRDELMLLLADQSLSVLDGPDGQEQLREQALDVVNAVLEEHGVDGRASGVYFTRLVMQ